MIKTFAVIVLAGVLGMFLGAAMGETEAAVFGLVFCIAASTAYIVRAIEKQKET